MQNRRILGIGGSAPAPTALRSQKVPFQKPQCKVTIIFTFQSIPFQRRPRIMAALVVQSEPFIFKYRRIVSTSCNKKSA